MCLSLKPYFVCLCPCFPGKLWKSKFDGLTTSVTVLNVAEAGAIWTPPAMASEPHRWAFIKNMYITSLLYAFVYIVKCLKKFWFKNRDRIYKFYSLIMNKVNHILELQYAELKTAQGPKWLTDVLMVLSHRTEQARRRSSGSIFLIIAEGSTLKKCWCLSIHHNLLGVFPCLLFTCISVRVMQRKM